MNGGFIQKHPYNTKHFRTRKNSGDLSMAPMQKRKRGRKRDGRLTRGAWIRLSMADCSWRKESRIHKHTLTTQISQNFYKLLCGSAPFLGGGRRGELKEEEKKMVTLVNGDHLLDLRQVCVVVSLSTAAGQHNGQGKLGPFSRK